MQDMEIIRSRGANGFETDADRLKKEKKKVFKEMRTLTGNQWS